MNKDVFISLFVIVAVVACITIVSYFPYRNDIENDQYVVIFPPSTSLAESYGYIVQAGGLPIRSGFFDNIILAKVHEQRFFDDLNKQTASIVLKSVVTGGCFSQNKAPLRQDI